MNNNCDRILELAFLFITTLCALYIAYAALQHTVKPRIKIILLNPKKFFCDEEILMIFGLKNIGYLYAKPVAANVTFYFNFDSHFDLRELLYGSAQELTNNTVRIGVGKMKYLKATGIYLTHGEEAEEVHVKVKTPLYPGKYKIRVVGLSENGVSFKKEYYISCLQKIKNVDKA